jgi:homoserine kinase
MENNIQENKVDIQKAPPLGGGGGVGSSIKVFAPATVANVVCGFDVLGFAVNAPGDEVIMRLPINRASPSAKLPAMTAACLWIRLRTP